MANFERYEPRADKGRAFDGGESEDQDEEGSRLPLLLVIGLLVVAAFAGVVWLAYTQGVQRGQADAPRLLVAANGPVKVAPANPGGVETPFKGLKIYQQPAPADDEDADSAPQPPTPKAAIRQKIAETPPPPAAETMAAPSEEYLGGMKPVAAPAAAPVQQHKAVRPPRALVSAQKGESVPALKSTAEITKPAPAKVPATAPSSGGRAVMLQIGAYKSEDEANAAWRSFEHKHPIVGGYQPEIRKVDLADKGVWYRLRLGSFDDKDAAVAFCDKLKADGGTCFLAK
ncbi:MAG: SPOR domain-containing protein [Rhizomicrobium sp.]